MINKTLSRILKVGAMTATLSLSLAIPIQRIFAMEPNPSQSPQYGSFRQLLHGSPDIEKMIVQKLLDAGDYVGAVGVSLCSVSDRKTLKEFVLEAGRKSKQRLLNRWIGYLDVGKKIRFSIEDLMDKKTGFLDLSKFGDRHLQKYNDITLNPNYFFSKKKDKDHKNLWLLTTKHWLVQKMQEDNDHFEIREILQNVPANQEHVLVYRYKYYSDDKVLRYKYIWDVSIGAGAALRSLDDDYHGNASHWRGGRRGDGGVRAAWKKSCGPYARWDVIFIM